MLKKLAALVAGAALVMAATGAMATTIGLTPSDSGLQNVMNSITKGGLSSVNAMTDMISDGYDAYWNVNATGGSVSTMVIELGSYAPNNKLYIYDNSNILNTLLVFDGSNDAGDQLTLNVLANGTVQIFGVVDGSFVYRTASFGSTTFGYLLDSSFYAGGGLFYSDSTLNEQINGDVVNHMLAYQGTGDIVQIPPYAAGSWSSSEYLLAFEDLNAITGSDFNFTDMVVMVESVTPVPEPGTMLLLGVGMLAVAIFGKRRMCREL
jgi:hypothetical protein